MTEIKTRSQAFAEVKRLVDARQETLAELLPGTAGRFRQLAYRLCEKTPALLECTPISVAGAILEAAELQLPLGTHMGYAWLVPYKDKRSGTRRAVFIPGYRGLMEMARRSGHVQHIWADVIRGGDEFAEYKGSKPRILHTPYSVRDRNEDQDYLKDSNIEGAYACAKLTTGLVVPKVLSIEEIEAVRRRSPAGNSGPWVTDYPAMCMKTVVRRLCGWLPLSPEDQRIVSRDEAFDQGREPDITEAEAEWEEKAGPATTSMTPDDLTSPLPEPITRETYDALLERANAHQLSEMDLGELCDKVAGTTDPQALSQDEAKEVLQRIAANA